jgi:hypothetical protein
VSDEITPEDKAEMLVLLFNDALGKLAAQHAIDGTLDDLADGFMQGSVLLEFSRHGIVVKVATTTPPPASPN